MKGLGENLWMTSARQMDKVKAAEQASQGWFSELEKYGVGQENKLTMQPWNRPKTQIGHYTRMVWQNSYKLGPQYGNMMNSPIYEKGNPCTKDSDCGPNASCSRQEALCIVRG
ncbi:hypothetical protein Aduo_013186 [Ancylostoma duodenale]